MSDTFLTPEELAELTGCRTIPMQLRWLNRHECPHYVSARGTPVVSRAAAEQHEPNRMATDPVPSFNKIMKGFRVPNKMVGVYFLIKDGAIQYIGQTRSFFVRMAPHAAEKDFDSVILLPFDVEELDDMEAELIARYQPPLNKHGIKKTARALELEDV